MKDVVVTPRGLSVTIIDLNERFRHGDCPMCETWKRLDHAVGWYEEAVHEEIGATLPHRGEVGGMCVCKACHDDFYARPA